MRNIIVAAVVLVLGLSLWAGKVSITQAPQGESEVDKYEIADTTEGLLAVGEVEDEEPLEDIPQFPESVNVLDAPEYNAVNILKDPDRASESIGSVFGDLMHVDIIDRLDNGFTMISAWDYHSMKTITGYVPTESIKTINPVGEYKVMVSLGEQKTYIYKDDQLDRVFVNSTGIDENSAYTPKGVYLIGDRGASFFSGKFQQGGYNWVRFNNNYLFHSIPFDQNQDLIPEEAEKLGQKASHGCIRHSIEDAQWFYDNIQRGTLVLIQE